MMTVELTEQQIQFIAKLLDDQCRLHGVQAAYQCGTIAKQLQEAQPVTEAQPSTKERKDDADPDNA